jgi:hypothetical protein
MMATRGATVNVTFTPGRTTKLLSMSMAGGEPVPATRWRKASRKSMLLNEGPATTEKLVRTLSGPIE